MTKNKILILAGPTAVGKTRKAIILSELLPCEVISADSRQVYKYMNIGTSKPTIEEQIKVRHHCLDLVYPDEPFDAAKFCEYAYIAFKEIITRGNKPVMVGGTGLYIRAFVDGIFTAPDVNPEIRKKLKKEAEEHGLKALYHRLCLVDPEASQKIHPNDQFRIIRALEVYEATGKGISYWQRHHTRAKADIEPIFIGFFLPREILYQKIEQRVYKMIKMGFVEEVANLLGMGYSAALPSMQGLGYKHIVKCLEGHLSLEEAIKLTVRDTRRYAKRQMTWFNKEKRLVWFNAEEPDEKWLELALNKIGN